MRLHLVTNWFLIQGKDNQDLTTGREDQTQHLKHRLKNNHQHRDHKRHTHKVNNRGKIAIHSMKSLKIHDQLNQRALNKTASKVTTNLTETLGEAIHGDNHLQGVPNLTLQMRRKKGLKRKLQVHQRPLKKSNHSQSQKKKSNHKVMLIELSCNKLSLVTKSMCRQEAAIPG